MILSRISFLAVITLWTMGALAFEKPNVFGKEQSPLKAVVFLSSFCPCSKSHVDHLNFLSKTYPNFKLFGVITDEYSEKTQKQIREYYDPIRFQFPIIQDENQTLVKQYKALKTPHVVLLKRQADGQYTQMFEGGISDQRDFAKSKKKYLEADLAALQAGRELPYSNGRSLGCYIRRL